MLRTQQWITLFLLINTLLVCYLLLTSRSSSTSPMTSTAGTVVIYNRVPKTGSTTVMNVLYRLAKVNAYSGVHVNITKNKHTLSLPDQTLFAANVTSWHERQPAVFHGHFAYIDFTLFSQPSPIYIQVVREPLDRFVTYYYFLRCGDDHRPHLTRSKAGDNTTFDECVTKKGKECEPNKMWLQIPFFCGHHWQCWQPGSRWALEQAKFNLVNRYLLVGVTERLDEFVQLLEATLPHMFDGASDMMQSGDSHVRRTKCKVQPSATTVDTLKRSTVWQMENAFYQFALQQFEFALARWKEGTSSQLHYEKIRPSEVSQRRQQTPSQVLIN